MLGLCGKLLGDSTCKTFLPSPFTGYSKGISTSELMISGLMLFQNLWFSCTFDFTIHLSKAFGCIYKSKKYLPWLERGRRVLGKIDPLSNTSNSPLYEEVPSSVMFSHLSLVSMKAENSASNPLGLIIHLTIQTARFPSSQFPISTTTFQWDFN